MPELTVDLQSKVNDIISYILDSRFQAIKDGYGILADKKGIGLWDGTRSLQICAKIIAVILFCLT